MILFGSTPNLRENTLERSGAFHLLFPSTLERKGGRRGLVARWLFRVPPSKRHYTFTNIYAFSEIQTVAAVAEWYRYRTVACFVTGSSPVPLKTRRVGQRCTLNLSSAETSSRWCGVVVRRGGASSGVVHVT
ncbi:uncharacterized protein TNCV_4986631 [Trichonephila clavipes]|nr:uncharacterized protein TNCV_4986631 [Trichonephila clavipes]